MTVLVFGGSGQIGRFLLRRLCERGEPVLAVSRRAASANDGVNWLEGALPDRVPGLPALSAILSCGPLDAFSRWLADCALGGGLRVVAVGSMSAQSKLDSPLPDERALARVLHESEQALAQACAERGWTWTVLRPTLVYGAGLDNSLSPLARRAVRTRVFPIPLSKGLRQPVHADDVAQAMLAALDAPAAHGRILPIGGGERLAAAQMFQRVRRSLPVACLPVPLPLWPLRLGALAAPRLRGAVARLDEDLVADNAALEQTLGVHPRPFEVADAPWWP